MTITDLWLVRHGESVGNQAATRAEAELLDRIPLDIRDADVPLSDVGVEQAEALGTWYADHRGEIDAIWVSPYLRARQTLGYAMGDGALTAAAPDASSPEQIVVRQDERLRDRELGILDLLTRRGVARLHPEEAERRQHLGKYYHRPPGGESWADLALRLRSFLGDAFAAPASSGLIVAHDAVVMVLISLLVPLDEPALLDFASTRTVLNASVTHLTFTGDGWQVVEFSDVAHLQREGADVTVHPGNPDVEPK